MKKLITLLLLAFIAPHLYAQVIVLQSPMNPIPCNGGSTIVGYTIQGMQAPYIITGTDSTPLTTSQASNTFTALAGTYIINVLDANNIAASTVVIVNEAPPLVATVSNTPSSCSGNNGVVTVTATGGTAPYYCTISGLSGVFSVPDTFILPSGGYTVVVTDDNNCSTSTTIVSVNNSISLSLASTICSNSITLNTSNGVPPYTYTINGQANANNTFSNLAIGSYTIQASDVNNCTGSYVYHYGGPFLGITIDSIKNPLCNGGDGLIYCSSNGTVPSNITISPHPIGLTITSVFSNKIIINTGALSTSSVFTITATSNLNACSQMSVVTIAVPAPIVTVLDSVLPATCSSDGKICITANGGIAPYTYLANNLPFNNCNAVLPPGSYALTSLDSTGCSSNLVYANVPLQSTITASISLLGDFCTQSTLDLQANVSGGTPPYTYSWTTYPTTANPPISNNNLLSSSVQNVYYELTVTDVQGCTQTASYWDVNKVYSNIPIYNANLRCNNDWGDTISLPSIDTFTLYGPNNYVYSSYYQIVMPTVAVPTTFTLVASANSFCNDSATVFVVPNNKVVNPIVTPTSCSNVNNGSVALSATPVTSNTNYCFNSSGVWPPQSNCNTTGFFNNLSTGSYYYYIIDSLSCADSLINIGTGTGNCGSIQGFVNIDANSNCMVDANDGANYSRKVTLNPGGNITFTNNQGFFQYPSLVYGTYTVSTAIDSNYFYEINPVCANNLVSVLNSNNPSDSLQLYDSIYSIWTNKPRVDFASATCIRPALTNLLFNAQTTTLGYYTPYSYFTPNIINNGTLYCHIDSMQYFGSAIPAPTSISGDTLYWSNVNLNVHFNTIALNFNYPLNQALGFGQQIQYGILNTTLPDPYIADNHNVRDINICTSYDPNDKQVWPQGSTSNGYTTLQDSVLTYQVRFQNTGNAPAGNVIIVDTIDSDLDINTLHVVGWSHNYIIEVVNNSVIKFKFLGIMLPDTGTNYEASQGYIIYTLQKKPSAGVGSVVNNTAHIYFDYNPAIVTNTTTNTYYKLPSINTVTPSNNTSCLACGNGAIAVAVIDGIPPFTYNVSASCSTTTIVGNVISNLPGGNYTVTLTDAIGNTLSSVTTIANAADPVTASIAVTAPSGNALGKIVVSANGGTQPYTYTWQGTTCNSATCTNIDAGTYTVTIIDANGCSTSKVVQVQYPASVTSINNNITLAIYPNPATISLNVTCSKALGTISLSTQTGQVVWQQNNITEQHITIPVQSFAKGIYYLRTLYGVRKVVVE
jgi:hypothetical protein